MHIGKDFYDNIHSRWIVNQYMIEESLKKFIFRQIKYNHFTRVRMRRAPKWRVDDEKKRKSQENNLEDSDKEEEDDMSHFCSSVIFDDIESNAFKLDFEE